MSTNQTLTVSALNNYIKSILDNNIYLQNFLIEGEISNFKAHSSGHLYFALKDNSSQINCIMFASHASTLDFKPKNGDKVILRGRLSAYTANGTYQIYVGRMKLAGIGDLYLKFEKLKKELNALGYFSPERKKVIPRFSKKIGVITSPTGAVIRDIIETINKRYNKVEIILYPVKVQGEGAKEDIARALNKANIDSLVDVIILARGGGSMEDLWPFNERIVADAIYNSKIPVISAVGHETDFTISDYVADLRSPTPTAAGTYVVPDLISLTQETTNYLKLLTKIYNNKMVEYNLGLIQYEKRFESLNPINNIKNQNKDLVNLYKQIDNLYNLRLQDLKNNLKVNLLNISKYNPILDINLKKKALNKLETDLNYKYNEDINNIKQNFNILTAKLDSLSPLKVLDKGFSMAKVKDKYINSIKQVKIGDKLITRVKDGEIVSKIEEVK